ncbi:hypothetical protein [Methylomonas albis]|nr:hypothetical protein [Methylomonas albis]
MRTRHAEIPGYSKDPLLFGNDSDSEIKGPDDKAQYFWPFQKVKKASKP